jgi:hypothetical protein
VRWLDLRPPTAMKFRQSRSGIRAKAACPRGRKAALCLAGCLVFWQAGVPHGEPDDFSCIGHARPIFIRIRARSKQIIMATMYLIYEYTMFPSRRLADTPRHLVRRSKFARRRRARGRSCLCLLKRPRYRKCRVPTGVDPHASNTLSCLRSVAGHCMTTYC